MMCNVLKQVHLMFSPGADLHDALPPAVPKSIPAQPHLVTPTPICLGPWGTLTGAKAPTVLMDGPWWAMQQGHDLGPLIPHICVTIPPSLLTPVVILTSASKSYFGASTTQVEGKPVAVAVAVVINFNLNCCNFPVPPLPVGMVVTWNTVSADMSLADFLCSLAVMVFEGLVNYGLSALFSSNGPLGKLLGKLGNKVFGAAMLSAFEQNAEGWLIASLGRKMLAVGAENLIPAIVSTALGSPLGLSGSNVVAPVVKAVEGLDDAHEAPPWTGWTSPVGNAAGKASDAVRKYFDSPDIEQHPSAPPGAAPGSP